MGAVEADRADQFVPLTEVRRLFERRWALTDLARRTGGPARYVRTDEGGTIGFIAPLSRNFCDGCNRVRLTCTGEMYMCLGQSAKADLRAPLRASRRRRAARRGDRRGHRPQAARPRFRDPGDGRRSGDRPAHVDDRRLSVAHDPLLRPLAGRRRSAAS